MLNTLIGWLMDITNAPIFYMPTFGVFQIIDILIIAVLLYHIIRWIRRTQALILLKGIGFIILIAVAAEIFDLAAVQWIVSNTIGMGFVVLIILFQPELRKALEQIGRGPFLRQLISEAEQNEITTDLATKEIIRALRIMSKSLTGALIVFEQEIDLSDQMNSGISVEAKVTSELLVNIFEKNTPLHDGAVIISKNRISAAACILPLTSEALDSSLGTRHRAAVGVCEISDAFVIVVSEETGRISMVQSGNITRDVSEDDIREVLLYNKPEKTKFSLFKSRR